MKKILVVVIALATMLTMLGGCGVLESIMQEREPELQPIEKAQARAVEIGRRYLDFELTAKEAKEMLDSIKVPEVSTGHGQLSLEVDIGYLSFIIGKQGSSYAEVEKKVNWIESYDYTK